MNVMVVLIDSLNRHHLLAEAVGPGLTSPLGTLDFLFHREEDPNQQRDLWDDKPRERRRMLELTKAMISDEGAPAEQYERLGLPV
jgi:hypothetical protein